MEDFYNIAQIKKWKSLIGFSGTLSDSTITGIKSELENDTFTFKIPSLRKCTSRLVNIIETT